MAKGISSQLVNLSVLLESCSSLVLLSQICNLNLSCRHSEFICDNDECKASIECFCDNIVQALMNASEKLKVKFCNNVCKPTITWDFKLKILKQKSIEIHELWKRIGSLHRLMV